MMRKNTIVMIMVILFLLIVLSLCYFLHSKYSNKQNFYEFIESNVFYDEHNRLINHRVMELDEQQQCFNFIKPDDIVLELGGRYGSVSVVINKLVNSKNKHVVVEPDHNVIPSLVNNRKINNCHFQILPKFISNQNKKMIYSDYGTRLENTQNAENTEGKISYTEFKSLFPQTFNVLVADCEGCLEEFLEMMGDDFNDLNKIIYEEDQPHLSNYESIKNKLLKAGFTQADKRVERQGNYDMGRYVYTK